MKRLCVICEGHTEAQFVKDGLEPHLRHHGLVTTPSLLKSGPGRPGGGAVNVERLARHVSHEYHHFDHVTTLVDYYGFGRAAGRTRTQLEADLVERVSKRVSGFDPRRFLPYVQMHEFEALLFSDVEKFTWVLDGWDDAARKALSAIRSEFPTPEDINNHPDTAPSKRILKVFRNGEYSKTEHGPLIAEDIGIAAIRRECAQFDAWIASLEALGGPLRN